MLLHLVLLFLLPSSSHPFLFANTSNLIAPSALSQCTTGNPIDDCWLCSPTDWRNDLLRLADCSIGFGRSALGGKNGRIYTVTDPSDSDPSNPIPGTLRHAAIQTSPLWIIFAADMSIHLNEELRVNSYKTLDGRGATVHITGGGCIGIRNVSNVIVHNLHIHDCVPGGKAEILSSPTEEEFHGKSDGDGITILAAQDVWVDHCSLSSCTDGLIDVTRGSTRVTISNNFFSNHDKVMLLGHSDDYTADTEMQVTIAFNKFGEKLVQRMPRCRHGYFHVVNNDYTGWEMYAVGGSANPTINCQGNRYTAPADPNFKEVTKRIDTEEDEWRSWNWRSEGDIMLNGAFFVTSGDGSPANYEKASSFEALAAELVDQLTRNVGVLILPRVNGGADDGSGDGGGDGDGVRGGDGVNGSVQYPGMMYEGGAPSSLFGIQLLLPLFIIIFIINFSSR